MRLYIELEETPSPWIGRSPAAMKFIVIWLAATTKESPLILMSKFPPKGNPLDLVEYTPISLSYDLSCDLVSELQITIKVDGEVVNFNGRKINLVLEFI